MKRFRIQTSCLTDQGKRRAKNEDRYVIRTLDDGSRILPLGLYAVLDGLGGHPEGERAAILGQEYLEGLPVSEVFPLLGDTEPSRPLVADKLQRHLLDALLKPLDVFKGPESGLPACVGNRLRRICFGLAYKIYKENISLGRKRPAWMMGTTLVLALVVGDAVVFLNVGDSAMLWVDETGATKLAHEQEDPATGVLIQALGISPPDTIEPETGVFEIPREGCLVLCSDGLSDLVPPGEVADVANRLRVAPLIATELVNMANTRGGHDNITLVVIAFEAYDPTP
jgi:serine/threonine protein phosphatase PrpC